MNTIELVLSQLIIAMLIASAVLWFFALRRLWAGQPLVELEPPRAVSWGLIDLVIAFFLLFLISAVFLFLGNYFFGLPLGGKLEEMSPGGRAGIMLESSLATLVVIGISWFFIVLRTPQRLDKFARILRRGVYDVVLGAKAFLMLAPPVFAMQGILTQFSEYKHPLIDMILENPDPLFFWVSGFSAVIAAPLAEEYLFRKLLQGWFEKLTLARENATSLLFGDSVASESRLPAHNQALELDTEQELEEYPTEFHEAPQLPYWPILLSSIFFTLPHANYGLASMAPLFVLALGLGYLYRQTHRLTASITVHALLNGTSTAMLIFTVYGKSS